MTTAITVIGATDLITNSRAVINANFDSLLNNKIEVGVLDTDTTLSANSDERIPSQKAVKAYYDQQGISTSLTGMVIPYAGSSAPTGWLLCNGQAVSRTDYAALFTLIGTTYGAGDGATTFNVPNLGGRSIVGVGANTKVFTFASRSSDTITVTGSDNSATNEIQTGQAVLYDTTSGAITGLTDNTTYYAIRVAYNQLKLASSLANAQNGTAITLSSDGSGTQTFTITLTTRTLAETGGEETHAQSLAEVAPHTHPLSAFRMAVVGGGSGNYSSGSNLLTSESASTGSTGSSNAMNNMSPFLALNFIIKT